MEKILRRKSIQTEILSILFLSIIIITTALGYLSFNFSRVRLISMLGESSRGIAATAANFINGNDLLLIRENMDGIKERNLSLTNPTFSDVYGKMTTEHKAGGETLDLAIEKYLKYTNLLSSVKEVNRIESPVNVYVMDQNKLMLLLTSDKAISIGAHYLMRREAQKVLASNTPISTGIYKDKDGVWISAFAPVPIPSSPETKAIIEVTHKIDLYLSRLKRELVAIIILCIIGVMGTALIGYHLVGNLVSAIKKLDEVADHLDKGNYNIRIDVKSDDEIGHLAETFEKLRLSIKKKIEELRLSLLQEKRAHLESIIALTNAIELRDPYTRQHLYRVDKYALLIAKTMRLPSRDIEKLRYGCYLHDIGKLYVEEELLKKTDLLEKEKEDIRKHSERGAKIIEGIPFLRDVVDIILYHQERYDGKGYPKGLKGKEIPLLARIVAVADAFDAMTTDRPYKKKLSFNEAIETIEKVSGTQFDPEVCDAFLKHRNSLEHIAKKHFNF